MLPAQLTALDKSGFEDLSRPGTPLVKLGIQHGDVVRTHCPPSDLRVRHIRSNLAMPEAIDYVSSAQKCEVFSWSWIWTHSVQV